MFASIPNFTEFYSEDINKGMECIRLLNEIIGKPASHKQGINYNGIGIYIYMYYTYYIENIIFVLKYIISPLFPVYLLLTLVIGEGALQNMKSLIQMIEAV